MYLYLGQDTVINDKKIVGIFDLDNTSISKDTRGYLAVAQKSGRIRESSADIPKSFVVCDDAVYLTQISPATLKKRALNQKAELL